MQVLCKAKNVTAEDDFCNINVRKQQKQTAK